MVPIGEHDDSGMVVLGAGLAGLGAATAAPRARVFEAKASPGGHAASHVLQGVPFDEGAHISHTKNAEFLETITRAAGDVHTFEPSIVKNWSRGRWIGYPIQNHLRDLKPEERVHALVDLIEARITAGEGLPASYREWCERQYGTYLTDTYYEAFTRKYWRRATKELATDWLGGRLIPADLENVIRGAITGQPAGQASFNRFHYPRSGGFFRFFSSLYDGRNIEYERRATEVDLERAMVTFHDGSTAHYEHLLTSIPIPTFVSLLQNAPKSVEDAAERLHHTKLLCVNVVVDREAPTDAHWCYVYDEDIDVARISFPGNLSPDLLESGRFAMQGEIFRDHREDWDVDELTERARGDLARMFRFDPDRDVAAIEPVVVPHAYIVSDADRGPAVDHILEFLRGHRVFPIGLYGTWRYMWSDQAFASGFETATGIMEGHD